MTGPMSGLVAGLIIGGTTLAVGVVVLVWLIGEIAAVHALEADTDADIDQAINLANNSVESEDFALWSRELGAES